MEQTRIRLMALGSSIVVATMLKTALELAKVLARDEMDLSARQANIAEELRNRARELPWQGRIEQMFANSEAADSVVEHVLREGGRSPLKLLVSQVFTPEQNQAFRDKLVNAAVALPINRVAEAYRILFGEVPPELSPHKQVQAAMADMSEFAGGRGVTSRQ